ncbi:MAG: MnhB domain-containing protein, partial [Jiangellaceae bacterium]
RHGRWRPDEVIAAAAPPQGARGYRNTWLRAGRTLAPERRSIIFEVVTRLVFHVVVVYSVFLLFTGHNAPGGGFTGGLVAGLALMVRYLAGGRHELDEAAPVDAGLVLGAGLFLATAAALAPALLGGGVLQSSVIDLHVPVLGDIHFVTSIFFDMGVYLVVIGLMLDILRSLGGGIDQQGEPDDSPETVTDFGRASRRAVESP